MRKLRCAMASIAASLGILAAQSIDLAPVVTKQVQRDIKLPGEFLPFETVDVRARVPGFIDRVLGDGGSVVKKGDVLVERVAPEMQAQVAEAELKAQAAESQRVEAEARVAALDATYMRLKEASATPGAIAGNELIQAEKAVDPARAAVRSAQNSTKAARAAVQALRDLEAYLKVPAPFSGVITDRSVLPAPPAAPRTRARPCGAPGPVATRPAVRSSDPPRPDKPRGKMVRAGVRPVIWWKYSEP